MVVLTEHEKNSGKIVLCAEPSADISDNIASSLAAAITTKGPSSGDKTSAELAASISKTLATAVQHHFKRTQGLQLYRDGMYNLCQARMNGIIDDATFMDRADKLLEKTTGLIEKELPHLANTQPTNTAGPNPMATSAGATGTGNTSTSVGRNPN